jgi:hypothetical protein
MDNGAMIWLDVMIDDKEAILMASAKSDGVLIADVEFILIIAPLVYVQSLMVRNTRKPACI